MGLALQAANGTRAVPVPMRLALAQGSCLDVAFPYNENLRQAMTRWACTHLLCVVQSLLCLPKPLVSSVLLDQKR